MRLTPTATRRPGKRDNRVIHPVMIPAVITDGKVPAPKKSMNNAPCMAPPAELDQIRAE